MPQVTRVLETALYVEDLAESAQFYERVLGLILMSKEDRLVAMSAGEGTVLLLFRRGGTASGASSPGGWIPPHDGTEDGPTSRSRSAPRILSPGVSTWPRRASKSKARSIGTAAGRASTFATSMATRWSLPPPGFGRSTDVARTAQHQV